MHTCMMPDSFQGIEFRGIGRQIVHLDQSAVVGEPQPNIPIFVIWGVVLNQEHLLGKVGSYDAFQVLDVRFGVEYALEMVEKPRAIQLDGTIDLERVPLPSSRYRGLRTYSRPGAVERRVLPEARFVLEEESPAFAFGFFLIRGYLYLVQRSCSALSAFAKVFVGRW